MSSSVLEKEKAPIRIPQAYRACDAITGGLLCFLVVFTPWAFGTTQAWSIWVMNIVAYALGVLLSLKWIIGWKTGYRPMRWGTESPAAEILDLRQETPRFLTVSLAALTVSLLVYCLISAVNARATYLPLERRFDYHEYIRWLPHSYDSLSTWNTFWSYLALAFFFWAARDWILGKTSNESRELGAEKGSSGLELPTSGFGSTPVPPRPGSPALPARLRCLLWVLCLNGALLALEGILQRLEGTNKLLWLVEPKFSQTPETQFGPYAYRANAASYLNLIWPVCLGFWLVLQKQLAVDVCAGRRVGAGSQILLLPCALIMAASPIFTTSRGAAFVTVALMIGAMGVLFATTRRESAAMRVSALAAFVVILGLAGCLGWEQFQPRNEEKFVGEVNQRTQIYQNASLISRDFPVFGTGPGTFGSIYQLYKDPRQEWAAYAHDDWLETRITWGWVGFGLVLLMLSMVLARWFFSEGISTAAGFVTMIWLSLAGCLAHAKFDFPFQVYSILLMFLLLCSILFSLSRKDEHSSRL